MNIRNKHLCSLALLCLSLSSCAGYQFRDLGNPFANYGIYKLAIPMFVNQSRYHGLAAPLTSEVIRQLGQYSGLKIISGNSESADAYLIGVIEGPLRKNEAFIDQQRSEIRLDELPGGENRTVGRTTTLTGSATVRFILAKRGREDLRKLMQGDGVDPELYKKAYFPDTVIDTRFAAVITYEVNSGLATGVNAAGESNQSLDRGNYYLAIRNAAKAVARSFNEIVVSAF